MNTTPKKDQVDETRRVLKDMNDQDDAAIDRQTGRSSNNSTAAKKV
jgi:hypothetical protein